jgi:hypothetical protein
MHTLEALVARWKDVADPSGSTDEIDDHDDHEDDYKSS